MIDLTPLDVRNKRGDFKRLMRGYDPHEVDVFLELVAERLEGLVRENLQLKERTQTLQQQVTSQLGREQAVQDALVTAQELRADIRAQSQREADHALKEAEAEARRMIADAEAEVRSKLRGVERRVEGVGDSLVEMERRRARFLKEFRQLLERELDVVDVEENRAPLEERAIDLDLGAGRSPADDHDGGVPPAEASADPDRAEGLAEPAAEGAAHGEAVELPVSAEPKRSGEAPSAVTQPAEDAPPPQSETSASEEEAGGAPPVALAEAAEDDGSEEPGVFEEMPLSEWAGPGDAEQLSVSPQRPSDPVPPELETPSFAIGVERDDPDPERDSEVDEISESMAAEAVAEAQSQVVEVTGADADRLKDVPRLEEVLAEAGAELSDGHIEPISAPPRTTEEIAPPSAGDHRRDLLYLDPDHPKAK